MKKTLCFTIIFTLLCGILSGCSNSDRGSTVAKPASTATTNEKDNNQETLAANQKEIKLVVSTIDGASYYLPFWIADQNGLFKEAGITLEYVGFDGGPIQMEAYESWDLGVTGIGGVISCTIGHDGVVLGVCNTDNATQNFWASPDSAIAQAGKGNNTAGETIYGDAETWKSAKILSGYGDVKHYVLLKTMEGFGLTIEDINVLWMDPSACLTSYFSGEGDAVAIYGAKTYSKEVQALTKVIGGADVDLGLYSYMVANNSSLKNEEKLTAIKKAVEIYYDTAEWIADNTEEAEPFQKAYYEFLGLQYTKELGMNVLTAERRFKLNELVEELFIPSEEGDYNMLQQYTVNIIKFYESCEVYEKSSAEKFLQPEHFNFDIVKEIYDKRK